VPLILIGNGVHLLAHPWFPRAEFGRLSPEPYGMTAHDRSRLSDTALDSIVPFGGGDRVLREARLASGARAFDQKERDHLRVVRHYVFSLYLIHLLGLVAVAVLAVTRRTRAVLRDGLAAGAVLTLGIAVFVGVYTAISPVSFLGGFHRFFFSGDSWRFAETETLRRLFPDAFWSDTALALGGLVALQAAVLLAGMLAWRKAGDPAGAANSGP
jgi:hypothetical protein